MGGAGVEGRICEDTEVVHKVHWPATSTKSTSGQPWICSILLYYSGREVMLTVKSLNHARYCITRARREHARLDLG